MKNITPYKLYIVMTKLFFLVLTLVCIFVFHTTFLESANTTDYLSLLLFIALFVAQLSFYSQQFKKQKVAAQ